LIDVRYRQCSLVFAALFTLALALPARAQQCELKEIVSLDMQDDGFGRVLVPIFLNDTPREMLIDTGAPLGILRSDIADALGLKKKPMPARMQIYRSNGEKAAQFVTIPSLRIGPEEAQYTDFIVGELTGIPNNQFAGTIGYDILRHFDLDFDFANKKLNLFSQDHCDGKVVYWTTQYTDTPVKFGEYSHHISVRMSLDGHDVDAIIDTGASQTVLNLTAAKFIFGLDPDSPGVEKLPLGTGAEQQLFLRYRFKTLSLSGITVKNPLIGLVPDAVGQQARRDFADTKMNGYQGEEASSGPPLILGTDVLRHLHFYIAYKEQKIYATAVDSGRTTTSAPPPASH